MVKRILCCMMILSLLLTGLALAEETTAYDSLTVGSTTHLTGEFFTDLWGNSASDYDVKSLLHAYNLVRWDGSQGVFIFDPTVVSGTTVIENEQKDRSYMMVLYDDLYYSDGTRITAWDYAFSLLFQISPEIAKIGGAPARLNYLAGYDDYISGNANYLAGVRVFSDNTLMITVSGEYLPFFYELGLLSCNPYPINKIAPGAMVQDDGKGVYLTNVLDPSAPALTADLLSHTVCDPERGYRSHPSVVSGPYTLTRWDGTTAEFDINPYFKGDMDGNKPTIPHLVFTLAENETMIEELKDGKFDLLNKVMNASAIMQGLTTISEGTHLMGSYPRTGLSFISFCCDRPTVASQAVRQAIAWSMDRDQIVQDYIASFGFRSDGYYGIGQWMYSVISGSTAAPVDPPEDENDKEAMAAYEATLAAWEEISMDDLIQYTVDTGMAESLLDGDGWVINADGVREKEIDGQKVTLELKLLYPKGNAIVDSLEKNLVPYLESVGIHLEMEAMEMADLLPRYYRQVPCDADMIYLATNFDVVFDPSADFREDENGAHRWAYTESVEEEMYTHAVEMRNTVPGDVLNYCLRWLDFQRAFNQSLPMLPIYTNVYFDFYTTALHNYLAAESISWGQGILGASLYAEETPAEEETGGEDDFDFESDEDLDFESDEDLDFEDGDAMEFD